LSTNGDLSWEQYWMSLISVIIPVYNGEDFLGAAIDSVLGQSIDDYELLVVDDGSTDSSPSIAKSFGERLTYLRKENGGVASALNHGISKAEGKYIAWLSHDDLFLPNKLERQLKFMRGKKRFKACYTDYHIIDPAGEITKTVETPWYPRQKAIRALFARMYINGSSMLIDRTVFDHVGLFNEDRKYSQDADMWFRILHRFEIGRVPEVLLLWRSHPGQGSRNRETFVADEQKMYRQAFESFGIEGIFPDLDGKVDDPKVASRAKLWFGDTMAGYHSWYDLAAVYYRQSMAIWPSIRNPAWIKLILNPLRPYRRVIGHCVRRWMGRMVQT
jgi:glycosyltransferase involved in cell wall biosynthesis